MYKRLSESHLLAARQGMKQAWFLFSSPETGSAGGPCEEFSRCLVCGRVWCGVLQRFGL